MSKISRVASAALDARCAAADALLTAATNVRAIVINPPMNIVLEPSKDPLHVVFDPALRVDTPEDMLASLRKIH